MENEETIVPHLFIKLVELFLPRCTSEFTHFPEYLCSRNIFGATWGCIGLKRSAVKTLTMEVRIKILVMWTFPIQDHALSFYSNFYCHFVTFSAFYQDPYYASLLKWICTYLSICDCLKHYLLSSYVRLVYFIWREALFNCWVLIIWSLVFLFVSPSRISLLVLITCLWCIGAFLCSYRAINIFS